MNKLAKHVSLGIKTKTMEPSTKKSLFLSVLAVISLASSRAAVITLEIAQNITGDSDVSTLGAFNRAYSFDVSSATVDSVNFSRFSAQETDTQLFSTTPNLGGYATGLAVVAPLGIV